MDLELVVDSFEYKALMIAYPFGWRSESLRQDWIELGHSLLMSGMTEDEALEVLERAYNIVQSEYL